MIEVRSILKEIGPKLENIVLDVQYSPVLREKALFCLAEAYDFERFKRIAFVLLEKLFTALHHGTTEMPLENNEDIKAIIRLVFRMTNIKIKIRCQESSAVKAAKNITREMGLEPRSIIIGYDWEITEAQAKKAFPNVFQIEPIGDYYGEENAEYLMIDFADKRPGIPESIKKKAPMKFQLPYVFKYGFQNNLPVD